MTLKIEKIPKYTSFPCVHLADGTDDDGLTFGVAWAAGDLIFDFGSIDDRYKVSLQAIADAVVDFRVREQEKKGELNCCRWCGELAEDRPEFFLCDQCYEQLEQIGVTPRANHRKHL